MFSQTIYIYHTNVEENETDKTSYGVFISKLTVTITMSSMADAVYVAVSNENAICTAERRENLFSKSVIMLPYTLVKDLPSIPLYRHFCILSDNMRQIFRISH